jgi:AraC family transcriptional regulator of adaptative response / DNA-3-methyladenine glycosylase II
MLTPRICEQARLARDPRFDGVFFVLVKTTKIFCRNICKVRMPLEKNVEYSASAQQALRQGYRPCLRCRPDSAPNSYAWQGVNTTVNRAVKLLTQRMDKDIESLADSLGITTRYLNKLFQEHLQISPKRYRIYQQVLMAKQLLQQTSLGVEKVAESVGFASARQLQQHVKTYLRLTPSQLRKKVEVDLPASGANKSMRAPQLSANVSILLAYRPPYNWPQVRDFFSKRQIIGNELVHENGLNKILSIESEEGFDQVDNLHSHFQQSKNVAVKVKISHAPLQSGFYLSFNAAHSRHTLTIISIVRRMLDLDASPQLIEQALKNAGLPENKLVTGLRIPGVASEFEAACRAILGQQISVAAAVSKVNQLHAHFAQHNNIENLEVGFPSPYDLANSDLLFLKMPAARRQTLIMLAKFYLQKRARVLIEDDAITSTVLSHLPIGPVFKAAAALIDIKGIGPWTVNYVALRALGESDIYLDTDLVIKQQMAKYEQCGHRINSELAAPWRSYLTLNLWSLA